MPPNHRIRIFIADDSAVTRSLLRSVVVSDSTLEIAGTAADGAAALDAVENLHPDLLLLDVEMPVMDGLRTLETLRARGQRLPVIMCSSLTQRGARVTIEALAAGASDYVAKPAGQPDREAALRALVRDLLPKIHALAPGRQPESTVSVPPLPVAAEASTPSVVVIGASTGGPAALDVLLPALPADFPFPVLVVQHMPEIFTRIFAERLDGRCHLRVREAVEGDPVRPGVIFIARGDWHLEILPTSVASSPATLHLNRGPLENHCRPAVDLLFRSAAAAYGADVLAVLLTGMGSDGLAGCHSVCQHGGTVLAQDQATSTVWGMPGAVVRAGLASKVLPLSAIPFELLRRSRRESITQAVS